MIRLAAGVVHHLRRAAPGRSVAALALHLPEQSTAQRSEGCSAIACRGLTLGGGIAWLMGKFGMAVDNLLSAEVVLSSSEVVIASEGTDPDLF